MTCMRTRRFEGLDGLTDVADKLATASAHDVYIDIGREYKPPIPADERSDPAYPKQTDRQAIWNARDGDLAYIGSNEYEITQHADVLGVITDALKQSSSEVGFGAIRDYATHIDGFVTLEGHNIDVYDLVGDGYRPPARPDMANEYMTDIGAQENGNWTTDDLGVGLRFKNSFDGSKKILLETMAYRHICQNWMILGKETIGSHQMLHVDILNPDDVESVIGMVIDDKDSIASQIHDAVHERYPIHFIPDALRHVGFGPTYRQWIIDTLAAFDINKRDVSLWQTYNAITQHLDHEVVSDIRAEAYQGHQERASRVLMGDIGDPSPTDDFEETYGVAI